jgi:hypothetical protein
MQIKNLTKNPVLNFLNGVPRDGVASTRVRLTAEEVKELRKAETVSHDEAIKTLLGFLRAPRAK